MFKPQFPVILFAPKSLESQIQTLDLLANTLLCKKKDIPRAKLHSH